MSSTVRQTVVVVHFPSGTVLNATSQERPEKVRKLLADAEDAQEGLTLTSHDGLAHWLSADAVAHVVSVQEVEQADPIIARDLAERARKVQEDQVRQAEQVNDLREQELEDAKRARSGRIIGLTR